MRIYIDSNCKCYTSNPEGIYREFDVPFFNDKCKTFIEGYRYCPKYENYIREDGTVFHGEMIAPFKPYNELASAQHEYERQLLNEYKESLLELGVEV